MLKAATQESIIPYIKMVNDDLDTGSSNFLNRFSLKLSRKETSMQGSSARPDSVPVDFEVMNQEFRIGIETMIALMEGRLSDYLKPVSSKNKHTEISSKDIDCSKNVLWQINSFRKRENRVSLFVNRIENGCYLDALSLLILSISHSDEEKYIDALSYVISKAKVESLECDDVLAEESGQVANVENIRRILASSRDAESQNKASSILVQMQLNALESLSAQDLSQRAADKGFVFPYLNFLEKNAIINAEEKSNILNRIENQRAYEGKQSLLSQSLSGNRFTDATQAIAMGAGTLEQKSENYANYILYLRLKASYMDRVELETPEAAKLRIEALLSPEKPHFAYILAEEGWLVDMAESLKFQKLIQQANTFLDEINSSHLFHYLYQNELYPEIVALIKLSKWVADPSSYPEDEVIRVRPRFEIPRFDSTSQSEVCIRRLLSSDYPEVLNAEDEEHPHWTFHLLEKNVEGIIAGYNKERLGSAITDLVEWDQTHVLSRVATSTFPGKGSLLRCAIEESNFESAELLRKYCIPSRNPNSNYVPPVEVDENGNTLILIALKKVMQQINAYEKQFGKTELSSKKFPGLKFIEGLIKHQVFGFDIKNKQGGSAQAFINNLITHRPEDIWPIKCKLMVSPMPSERSKTTMKPRPPILVQEASFYSTAFQTSTQQLLDRVGESDPSENITKRTEITVGVKRFKSVVEAIIEEEGSSEEDNLSRPLSTEVVSQIPVLLTNFKRRNSVPHESLPLENKEQEKRVVNLTCGSKACSLS